MQINFIIKGDKVLLDVETEDAAEHEALKKFFSNNFYKPHEYNEGFILDKYNLENLFYFLIELQNEFPN